MIREKNDAATEYFKKDVERYEIHCSECGEKQFLIIHEGHIYVLNGFEGWGEVLTMIVFGKVYK